jgi:internalin A
MLLASKLLGQERKVILEYWIERLKSLPILPERPIEDRISLNKQGDLVMDLSATEIVDLTPLIGMPLRELDLYGCSKLVDVGPISRLSLHKLVLGGTEVTDLKPLSELHELTSLEINATKIRDLSRSEPCN